ncbi:MAG: FHA domain-containing protein [Actinobacteria bacterium]|nr:MAG: FHA domain-containing protein [Actinomycetota bacterium]
MFNLVLFILKLAFLALLYIFLAFVVSSALRDIPSTAEESERRGRLRAYLLVHPGDGDTKRLRLHDNFSIGRAADSDLVLDNQFVSHHHAKIMAASDGFVLQDLDSTNGTFLDGQRVYELVPLRSGATIGIGKASIVYEEE